jgi:hypothetical protein
MTTAARVAARVAERLTILSGPELRQAAGRLVQKIRDDSFENIIAKAYLWAVSNGEEYRAKHLAKTVMVPEEVEALKKQLATEMKRVRTMVPEGVE